MTTYGNSLFVYLIVTISMLFANCYIKEKHLLEEMEYRRG